jgi:thiol-disulfide isomerase/thioredoxin
MKFQIKHIFACVASLIVFHAAMAQQSPVTLTGTFTEKVNAELVLTRKVNNKIQKLGDYNITPDNLQFVFTLPADTPTNYSFEVKIMKQGHMRLEVDNWYTLPLALKSGKNYSLKVIPSKLNAAKKTALELKADEKKPSAAFVSGKFVNWKLGANISIQRVVDGGYETVNGISGSKDNSFLLPCVVKQEGFYYISSLRWRQRIYLKPGDNLELAVDGPSGSYEVIKGSEENQLLQKWQQLISPITAYGYNILFAQKDSFDLTGYQKTYESLESSITNFRNSINHSGSKFSRLFAMSIDVDKELAPILFLFNSSIKGKNGFGSSPKNFPDVPDFYQRFAQPGKFNDASIVNIGEAKSYMNLYTKLVIASLPKEQKDHLSQSEKLGLMIHSIANDTLRSLFFKDQLGTIHVNNLSEFNSTFAPYKKYATSSDAQQKYKAVFQKFAGDTAWIGKSSYDFTLPDTNGRMVSMKDFKGKVIIIDVWATWCGPCKGEIPYMKAIEEEYRNNKEIVFMAISIDKVKDKQKWLDYIRKENLHGVQLLDDYGLAFGRKYQINAIPRFMLIDKKGNWIEVRCPIPSNTEALKKYLDEALKQEG